MFGLTAGAVEASSLKFYDDAATDTNHRFTLDCTGLCEGWILPTSVFSGSEGDMFSGIDPTTDSPSITGAADEIAAINARTGESFASITKTDMGGVASKIFNSSAAYFLIAVGKSPRWALVKNLTDDNKFTFTQVGSGTGFSHLSEAGDVCRVFDDVCGPPVNEVPLPAGLPLLMGALGITGIVARRRKKA